MTCTRLKLFGEDLKKLFIQNGWRQTEFEEADYIFVNTCSFLKSREDYFIKRINVFAKKKLSAQKLVVFGCLPSTNPERIKNLDSEIILFSRELNNVADFFRLDKKEVSLSHITNRDLSLSQKMIRVFNKYLLKNVNISFRLMKKDVFHIRISQGCLGRCSYCTERFTTNFKSRLISEVIDSFREGLKEGFRIFSINSDDSSCFGKDNKESIGELLKNIISLEEDFKVALTEFNPQGLFYSDVAESLSSKKISYITLPVQSGSQKILNSMRRPYKISKVINKIKELRKKNTSLRINTHIIVGFPGETENDFLDTIKLVRAGLFDRIKVFKYSDRLGTDSSLYPNKVSEKVKKLRERKLRKEIFIDSIKKKDLANFLLNLKPL